jgi:hydroxymethylglutaryl-CoA lyase
LNLPEKVRVCECFARDGLQREEFVPTDRKIEMINRISRAGFPKIEVTSFAHPKYLPQFQDAENVLAGIERVAGAMYLALVPNMRGFERMLGLCEKGLGPDGIIVVVTASESYNKRNVGKSIAESMEDNRRIIARAEREEISVIGTVGTAFGCPIEGDVKPDRVEEIAVRYQGMGVSEIMIGDTTGMANPLKTERVFNALKDKLETGIIAHFHDTRGMGIANAVAALQCGIKSLDSSLGGTGGGLVKESGVAHSGNVATEELVYMLREMGIETGINLEAVLDCVSQAEDVLGRRLFGKAVRSRREIY